MVPRVGDGAPDLFWGVYFGDDWNVLQETEILGYLDENCTDTLLQRVFLSDCQLWNHCVALLHGRLIEHLNAFERLELGGHADTTRLERYNYASMISVGSRCGSNGVQVAVRTRTESNF